MGTSDHKQLATATELRQRGRCGDTDDGVPELERGLVALKRKHLAGAQEQLTPAQHATFGTFLAEVTLQSLGAADWPGPT